MHDQLPDRSPLACEVCGYDPRATDRIHTCTTVTDRLRPGTPVVGVSGMGGTVLELRRGPGEKVLALVRWRGQIVGQWIDPDQLTVAEAVA